MSLFMTFLLLFQSVSSQFSLRSGFSDAFNQKFSNLSNASQIKNALSTLLNVTAPSIKSSQGYKMPFELNCSVVFDTEVEKIDCDTNFKNVQLINESCQAGPIWAAQNSNQLQARMIVGLAPGGRPQVMYWLRPKKTLSATLSLSPDFTASATQIAPASSTPLIYTCTGGTTTPPTNGLLAAWNASSGIYADATNQTNRYNISNWTALDTLTGIIWEQNVSATTMNFTQAQSYCADRNTGGLSGWRVPNIVELNTMYDYTLGAPRVNTTVFPGTTAVSFWSASPEIGNGGGNAWDLELGNQFTYYKTNSTAEKVRCVMACYPISPAGRYVNASGEVTDLVTGLIWQQVSTGSTMNWTNALTHCTGLVLNGHTWRLPRVRELVTIVDYSASYATLMMNTTVFSGEPASYFWSSSLLAGFPTGAWYVHFAGGDLYYGTVASLNFVRCLR